MHSGLRWLVLLALILALVNAFKKWKGKGGYGAKDKMINLMSMILLHTQALVGLILYFAGDMGVKHLDNMGNATARFFAIEHMLAMIIAVVLVTIGRKRAEQSKRDAGSHRKIWIWYGIAFIIIMLMIPWPFLSKFSGVSGYM